MQTISEQYRELNAQLHAARDDYGRSGQRWADHIYGLTQAINSTDVLDYGCGKGTLAQNLPFSIRQYDPAVEAHSAPPEPADIVVCTDVLEHIEPELIGNVLDHLQSLTRVVGFFVIATRPAKKTLPDGRNAHLIVEPARWWLSALWDRFSVTQFNVIDEGEFLAVVEPKKGAKNA